MKPKYQDWSYILIGIGWVIAGIILIFFKHQFVEQLSSIIAIGIGIYGSVKLFGVVAGNTKYIHSWKNRFLHFVVAILHIIFAIWLYEYQEHTPFWLIRAVGIYQVLMALTNLISYILMYRDQAPQRFHRLMFAVIHFIFGIGSLTADDNGENALVRLGIYAIFIGFTYWNDGRRAIVPPKAENRIKRHVRFPVPVIFHALLPQQLVRKINAYIEGEMEIDTNELQLELDNSLAVTKPRDKDTRIMQIAIHTSPHNIDIIGHVNITYDNIVYTYGNHDVDSRRLFGAVGDGTLVLIDREEYLQFTLDRDVTVIEYDIVLNKEQQEMIEEQLANIKKDVKSWKPMSPTQLAAYGGQLLKATNAKFYKFTQGQFKTYYVFWTNCVLLTDEVVGPSGLDMFALVGVLTPGTYYEYLEKEYNKPGSIVVGRRIYNQKLMDFEQAQSNRVQLS